MSQESLLGFRSFPPPASRRLLSRGKEFDQREQPGLSLYQLADEGYQLLSAAPGEQHREWRDRAERPRLVDEGEKKGNDVLADAAVVVRAGAPAA
ncbi:MAG TPA: hypothetical protein VN282_25725 [Pyrinomonadaceae bacterium]|nr:hypothetical protein [Pyrinomonadaceae bacterium]